MFILKILEKIKEMRLKCSQGRLNKKNFEDDELPHELCLITKETTKISNAFATMSTDKKLSKAQISRIIQIDLLVLA